MHICIYICVCICTFMCIHILYTQIMNVHKFLRTSEYNVCI